MSPLIYYCVCDTHTSAAHHTARTSAEQRKRVQCPHVFVAANTSAQRARTLPLVARGRLQLIRQLKPLPQTWQGGTSLLLR
jgi:hypothetical protein